jgi:hypothetical protein
MLWRIIFESVNATLVLLSMYAKVRKSLLNAKNVLPSVVYSIHITIRFWLNLTLRINIARTMCVISYSTRFIHTKPAWITGAVSWLHRTLLRTHWLVDCAYVNDWHGGMLIHNVAQLNILAIVVGAPIWFTLAAFLSFAANVNWLDAYLSTILIC